MLEHSSNNSSNLFALSSESSRSDLRKSKKHNYSSFVKKVKSLLEAEGDDLDQLYRKVEIIVKKYFDQHQIVEFGEMYNHIIALKSNSKKMSKFVTLLEKKLIQQQSAKPKNPIQSKHSDRSEDFEVTSSTHQNNKRKRERIEGHLNSENQITNDYVKQNQGSVISSIKYNYCLKPLQRESEAKEQRKRESEAKEQRKKMGNNREGYFSPSKYSPNKLNSSFEEYQVRNKQYEDKVKQLMNQLKDIKHSLESQPHQSEQESFDQVQPSYNFKEELKIKLEESGSLKEEEQVQQKEVVTYQFPANLQMTDTKKNRMSETKQSESLSINRESLNIQIKPESSIDRQKSNTSSLRTIGEQTSFKDDHSRSNKKRESQVRSVEQRKSVLLSQANAMTQQLQQLRQIASVLQIQSAEDIHQLQNKPKPQPETISSETKILELARAASKTNFQTRPESREEAGKSQSSYSLEERHEEFPEKIKEMILDKISNASSKMQITEEAIPSFKKVEEKPQTLKTSINVVQASSKIPEDSSVFSFSNTRFKPQAVQSMHPSYVQVPQQNSNYHIQPPPYYQGIPNNSVSYNSRPIGLEVSTVKQGFFPYPEQQMQSQIHHPQIRFVENEPKRSISITNKNRSYMGTPKQNTQFSLMLSKSQMPANQTQGIRISSNEKISREKNRYSHLKGMQNERNSSATKVRFVSPASPLENRSQGSLNSSSTSFKRRGLNMMLSPAMH